MATAKRASKRSVFRTEGLERKLAKVYRRKVARFVVDAFVDYIAEKKIGRETVAIALDASDSTVCEFLKKKSIPEFDSLLNAAIELKFDINAASQATAAPREALRATFLEAARDFGHDPDDKCPLTHLGMTLLEFWNREEWSKDGIEGDWGKRHALLQKVADYCKWYRSSYKSWPEPKSMLIDDEAVQMLHDWGPFYWEVHPSLPAWAIESLWPYFKSHPMEARGLHGIVASTARS